MYSNFFYNMVTTVQTKWSVGEHVWTINKYPAGCRIFESKIYGISITVDKYGTRIYYSVDPTIKIPFTEKQIFNTFEEAEAAKQEWINCPEVKEKYDKITDVRKIEPAHPLNISKQNNEN